MKIEFEQNSVEFKTLKAGEFFTHNGARYLKVFPIDEKEQGMLNAVCLSSGLMFFFDAPSKVCLDNKEPKLISFKDIQEGGHFIYGGSLYFKIENLETFSGNAVNTILLTENDPSYFSDEDLVEAVDVTLKVSRR